MLDLFVLTVTAKQPITNQKIEEKVDKLEDLDTKQVSHGRVALPLSYFGVQEHQAKIDLSFQFSLL
jgi:hypothetical protein